MNESYFCLFMYHDVVYLIYITFMSEISILNTTIFASDLSVCLYIFFIKCVIFILYIKYTILYNIYLRYM